SGVRCSAPTHGFPALPVRLLAVCAAAGPLKPTSATPARQTGSSNRKVISHLVTRILPRTAKSTKLAGSCGPGSEGFQELDERPLVGIGKRRPEEMSAVHHEIRTFAQ